jgi:hypothetical protein
VGSRQWVVTQSVVAKAKGGKGAGEWHRHRTRAPVRGGGADDGGGAVRGGGGRGGVKVVCVRETRHG